MESETEQPSLMIDEGEENSPQPPPMSPLTPPPKSPSPVPFSLTAQTGALVPYVPPRASSRPSLLASPRSGAEDGLSSPPLVLRFRPVHSNRRRRRELAETRDILHLVQRTEQLAYKKVRRCQKELANQKQTVAVLRAQISTLDTIAHTRLQRISQQGQQIQEQADSIIQLRVEMADLRQAAQDSAALRAELLQARAEAATARAEAAEWKENFTIISARQLQAAKASSLQTLPQMVTSLTPPESSNGAGSRPGSLSSIVLNLRSAAATATGARPKSTSTSPSSLPSTSRIVTPDSDASASTINLARRRSAATDAEVRQALGSPIPSTSRAAVSPQPVPAPQVLAHQLQQVQPPLLPHVPGPQGINFRFPNVSVRPSSYFFPLLAAWDPLPPYESMCRLPLFVQSTPFGCRHLSPSTCSAFYGLFAGQTSPTNLRRQALSFRLR